jgi:hypothetical protein
MSYCDVCLRILVSNIMSYRILVSNIMPYRILVSNIMPYRILVSNIMSYRILVSNIMPYRILVSNITPYRILVSNIMPYHVFVAVLWYPLRFQRKTIFGSFLPPTPFFVGGLISYVCYLCLFVCSDIQHVLTMSCMAGVLSIKDRSCLLFASTCMVHPRILGSVLLLFFY